MTNLHLHIQKAKRLGVNLTVLATSISLAACGGGGSEGYYGNNNNGGGTGGTVDPNTGTETKEVAGVTIESSKDRLNVNGDEVTVVVKAIDENGGGVSGAKINLNIAKALEIGASSNTSSQITDDTGKATFTVKLSKTLTTETKLQLTATIDGTTINNITYLGLSNDSNNAVSSYKLTLTSNKNLKVNGGEAEVTVRVLDNNGGGVAEQEVELGIQNEDFLKYGLSIKGSSKVKSDGNGDAKFTVVLTSGVEKDRSQIITDGILLKARLTESSGAIKEQTATVKVESIASLVNKLEISTSLRSDQVSAVNGQFTVMITATNPEGKAVANQMVGLDLNKEAKQYGASIANSSVKTNAQGQATFIIKTEATGKVVDAEKISETLYKPITDIDKLVASGLQLMATVVATDGSKTTQSYAVSVVAAISDEVDHLIINSSQLIDISGGEAQVVVRAVDKNGGVLKNKTIAINVAQAEKNRLTVNSSGTPSGSKTLTTDDNGEAKFTLAYDGLLKDQQVIDDLLTKGVQVVATYVASNGDGISNSSIVYFKSSQIVDVERLETYLTKGSVSAVNDTFQLKVRAINSKGAGATNQNITLELGEAAKVNGVTFDGAATKKTDNQGYVTYNIKVNAQNTKEIANLLANDIVLAISDTTGKTQNTRVIVTEPAIVENTVDSLKITPSQQVLSVLGDTVVIGVQALDANNKGVANKEVNFALSPSASSRVTVDKTSAVTNAQGIARFTIKISEGNIDEALLRDAITFAVNTQNSASPIPLTQVAKINVSAPAGTYNLLPLTPSKPSLLIAGDTVTVTSKLVDNQGAPLQSQPVTLVVNDTLINGGVNVQGGITAVTDNNGNVSFNVTLPAKTNTAQIAELLANGLTIKTSVTLPNGNKRFSPNLNLAVEEAVSIYHFDISPTKTNLNVEGDETLVAVTLLNRNNQPVQNKKITLTARNTAGTVIVTANGSVIATEPQTVTTDELGRGFYKVRIPASGFDQDLLVASGILLDASNTDDNGVITTQISRLNVVSNTGGAGNQLPSRYSIRLSSAKPTLNVRDDISDVTVTVIDSNGGGVAGKYVTLGISDFVRNGAIIVGPSGLTTDENGRATFRVKVDETARSQTYTATQFAADDLILTARLGEEGYAAISQVSQVNVVQSVVQQPVASIVIGVNPTEVGTSGDGVYYTRNMSASVVDFDGRPLSKQEVSLDITPLTYIKGGYDWSLVTDALGNQELKWVFNPSSFCPASATGTAVTNGQVTNIPVKVPTFLGQGSVATYTTDVEGKFDFTIRYPKIYAQWLNVRIGATSTVASLPNRTVYDLGLPSVSTDYSTDGTYGPNLVSPYGTTNSCP